MIIFNTFKWNKCHKSSSVQGSQLALGHAWKTWWSSRHYRGSVKKKKKTGAAQAQSGLAFPSNQRVAFKTALAFYPTNRQLSKNPARLPSNQRAPAGHVTRRPARGGRRVGQLTRWWGFLPLD